MPNEENQELPFTGALLDDRPEEEREKDYQFAEIVAATAPVEWVEKQECRRFPIFNQDGSGSCVAQTVAKLAGIMYAENNGGDYVHFSATHVYQRRVNKPSGGMIGINALDIARESITLEELVPSQEMTDAQMDGVVVPKYKDEVGRVFGFGNYVVLPVRDIETIASTIQQTGKGVMVWFYFTGSEWKRNVPVIKNDNLDINKAARHSVTAVDFTLLPDGRKAIIIEDSWGNDTGVGGQRIITEEFFEKRNFFAAYPIQFKFEDISDPDDGDRPRGDFQKNLEWSSDTSSYDEDVVDLQNILKYEGLFPSNVHSSGYYGSITAKAVLAWQLRHMKDYAGYPGSLHELKGRIVGPSTRAKLNSLYSK